MILPPGTSPGDILQFAYSDPRVTLQTFPGFALRYVYVGKTQEPDPIHWVVENAGREGLVVCGYESLGMLVRRHGLQDFIRQYWARHKEMCEKIQKAVLEWPDKKFHPYGAAYVEPEQSQLDARVDA